MGRDMESQMESELLELKMEREHLQRTVSLLMECVSQLNTQLEEEKEKNGKAWKENCRKLRTLDTELAEKDAVIGQLSWDQDQESGDAEQHQTSHKTMPLSTSTRNCIHTHFFTQSFPSLLLLLVYLFSLLQSYLEFSLTSNVIDLLQRIDSPLTPVDRDNVEDKHRQSSCTLEKRQRNS